MAHFYILNLAVCDFSLENSVQGGNMYNSYLGDLNIINSYINKIEKHDIHHKDTFKLTSLYLTYFNNEDGKYFGRKNKEIIKKLFSTITWAISKQEQDIKKYFICFIHSHGASAQINNESVNIKVDNYKKTSKKKSNPDNFFSISELVNLISPNMIFCDSFLILNSCFSADRLDLVHGSQQVEPNSKTFKDYDPQSKYVGANSLYILGLSSAKVWGNKYDENSYGIKILLSIFEMGLKLNYNQILDIFNKVVGMLPKDKIYEPVLTIVKAEIPDNNNAPKEALNLISPVQEYIIWNDLLLNNALVKGIKTDKFEKTNLEELRITIERITT